MSKCALQILTMGLFPVMICAAELPPSSTAAKSEATSDASATSQAIVHVPAFDLPPSRYMSEEAKQALASAIRDHYGGGYAATIEKARIGDTISSSPVEHLRAIYPVEVTERVISGVRTRIVEPKSGIARQNRRRVLLNLHGGGFFVGANGIAMLESIPIAAVGKTRVVTIDYRQGPEHKFPAATEDVIAVYRAMLKETKAENIGIYGCSAGGILTAMVTAALRGQHLPNPGAIGILGAGAFGDWTGDPMKFGAAGGDSVYWGPASTVGGSERFADKPDYVLSYLRDADPGNPLVSPAESSETLQRFPPTLLITGTRSGDMSPTVETHRRMMKAGVDADLHMWDGMWHCFFYNPDLPESREAYSVISRFFDRHLGR